MLDRADAILKLAAAAALLILATGIGYYYGIFLPEQGASIRIAAAEKEKILLENQQKLANQKETKAKATSAEYDTCVSISQSDYHNRWNQSCKAQNFKDSQSKNTCLSNAITPSDCSYITVRPEIDCQLPKITADKYDEDLRNDKQICLEKLKASQPY